MSPACGSAEIPQVDNLNGYLGGAQTLIRLGRPVSADALYREAMARCGISALVLEEYAWCAHHQGDVTAERARWQALQAQFPDEAIAYLRLAELHIDAGEFEQA